MLAWKKVNDSYTKESPPSSPYHKGRYKDTARNTESISPYTHEKEHNHEHDQCHWPKHTCKRNKTNITLQYLHFRASH